MKVSEKAARLVAEYVSALLDDNTTRSVDLKSARFLREQKARLELDAYVAALEAALTAAIVPLEALGIAYADQLSPAMKSAIEDARRLTVAALDAGDAL